MAWRRIIHLPLLLAAWPAAAVPVVISDAEAETLLGLSPDAAGKGFQLLSRLRSESWLEQWLWNLRLQIPTISQAAGGFNIKVSDGVCTHFKVAHITTQSVPSGLSVTASGLDIHCDLKWDAKNLLFHFFGDVDAEVNGASIGGPVTLASDSLQPPLPQSINAHGCSGSIQAELSFSGSGISMVLEFLKPLIQSYLNKRLSELICGQVDTAINEQGSAALRNVSTAVRKLLQESPTPPPTPVVEDPKHQLVDFGKNSGLELLHSVITKVLGNNQSPHSANALLGKVLGPDGNFSLDSVIDLPLSKVVSVDKLGTINITLQNLSFSHLNTVSAMNLHSPQPQEVQLLLAMQQMNMQARLSLGVQPAGPISGGELRETFTTSLGMSELTVGGKGFLALNQSYLGTLGFDQLTEMGCVAKGTDAGALLRSNMGAKNISAQLIPEQGGQGDLEHDLDHMLNVAAGFLLGAYQEALHAAGQKLLINRAMEMVNSGLQAKLQNAGTCPPPFEDYSNFTLSAVALLISLAMVPGAMLVAACTKRSRKESRQVQLCQAQSVATSSTETGPTSLTVETGMTGRSIGPPTGAPVVHSLAFHPRTHPALRWALPMLMVATMLMFLSSNSSVAAVVTVSVSANGESMVHLPPTFGFSLIGSIKDMIKGKVYGLAVLIICFSGIWPYVKPMLMMLCWFAPPSQLSVAKRQGLLNFLDAFGKWSLVDTFVMVMFMVAFKFDLSAPTKGSNLLSDILKESGDEARIQVQVEALLGFYTFLIASFVSLILGHITTACHRYAHKLGEFGMENNVLEKRRLCYELCSRPLDVHGPTAAISVSLLLVLCGTFLYTFNFNFLGLAGYALGKDEQQRPFSVFSLGMQIRDASADPNGLPIILLQGVFFLFAMIIVVAYHVILIVLWAAPMTTRMQKQFFLTAQVFNAWSGLDVFCVTILAGVLEIRQFAGFIVGDTCAAVNKFLAKSALADKLPGGPTCFDVDSTLRAGFPVLAIAVVISTVTGQVMLSRCSHALCEPRTNADLVEEA
ncbi:unnamed protein product [Effrenium voratum]|uniref:Uncharacterized protein n=2 Tax=Effrenium voratum TaxID=2562239 RepID=A0AA36JD12_9DINO|nr:unnamed protein product [Effrenium voratum]